jgi:hypothetical protein
MRARYIMLVEKWEKNQKVFAASDPCADPVIGCPGHRHQPRLEIRQDHQIYSPRGHGRAHDKLHLFDFRHSKIQVFPLPRPDFFVNDTLGMDGVLPSSYSCTGNLRLRLSGSSPGVILNNQLPRPIDGSSTKGSKFASELPQTR